MLSLADAWNAVSGMELVEEFDSRPDNPVVVQSNAGKRTEKGQNVQGTAREQKKVRTCKVPQALPGVLGGKEVSEGKM